MRLQLNLLGGVSILLDGKPIKSLSARVAQALLIYVLHQPRAVAREQLAYLFFGASEPEQATANLRRTLSAIKKELGAFVDISRYEVGVREGANVTVDSIVFSEQLSVNSEQFKSITHHASLLTLQDTLTLYQGDFLAHFYLRDAPEFEQWQLQEQERLRLLAIDGLRRLVKLQQEAGDFRGALFSAESLLKIEPLLEQAHRDKMLLLARTGQRGLALRHYAKTVALFDEELGVPVADETTTLFEHIQRLQEPAPLVLPVSRRQFIGRTAELTTLQRLLAQPERRLITLLGTGGIGKTRLSQEAARHTYAETPGLFLDGIYFVELAGIDSAEATAIQIAQVLGIQLGGKQAVLQQVIGSLRTKEQLLILDNFEQLTDVAADLVAELLAQAPDLKLLITSRRRLNLYEESVLDLAGLQLPSADDAHPSDSMSSGEAASSYKAVASSAAVASYEAVQLFLSNAQQQRLNFAPTPDEIGIIASICRLLDGVPLAIELAAGWVRQYGLPEIVAQIEDGLDFLATTMRNVPERQRSLRAVFLHSWALLSAELQPTFAKLSLFAGGFTSQAAQTIAGATADDLQALVDRSLLQETTEQRFAVHPLVGEFSAEKLVDPEPLMQRFVAYYAEMIDGIDKIDHWPTFTERLPAIQFAFDNVQKAWRWQLQHALEHAGQHTALQPLDQMRRPLRSYFLAMSQIYAGHLLFRKAHEQLEAADWANGSAEQRLLLAKIAIHDADLGRIIGDYPRSVAIVDRHIGLLEDAEAHDDLHSALLMLREGYRYVGRSAEVAPLTEKLEHVVYQLERDELVGAFVMEQAHAVREAGDRNDALALYKKALKLLTPNQNPRYMAIIHDYMGMIYSGNNEIERAISHQKKALAFARSGNLTYTEAVILLNLPLAYDSAGDLDKALATVEQGRQLLLQMNQQALLVVADRTIGDLYMRHERWVDALPAHRAALRRAQQLDVPRITARVLARLPLLFAHLNMIDAAWHIVRYLDGDETLMTVDRRWLQEGVEKLEGISAEAAPSQSIADNTTFSIDDIVRLMR